MTRSGYPYREVLCENKWVANNLNNPNIKVLEVDYDPENAYKEGHVPGTQLVWWKRDINDPIRRDIIDKQLFEALMSRIGATYHTELICMAILIIGLPLLYSGSSSTMATKKSR